MFQTLYSLGKSERAWAALLVTCGPLGEVPSIYPSCYTNINTFYVNDDMENFGAH